MLSNIFDIERLGVPFRSLCVKGWRIACLWTGSVRRWPVMKVSLDHMNLLRKCVINRNYRNSCASNWEMRVLKVSQQFYQQSRSRRLSVGGSHQYLHQGRLFVISLVMKCDFLILSFLEQFVVLSSEILCELFHSVFFPFFLDVLLLA